MMFIDMDYNKTSIGTNFTAKNGNMHFDIGNDLNLYNAMDYNYEYHYLHKSKFDIGSALANVGAAVAVGAMTGGAGAAAMAGISSGIGASQMQKGKIDITMNYDETAIGNNLIGNNINIKTGNNFNSVSTNINDTTIDTFDTLMNMANNSNNNTTKLNLNIGNGIGIAVAEEKHEHEEVHDTWGGNIGRAALGGAITGLASGIGVNGGEYLGNIASSSISNATLSTAINSMTNAMTISTMNTVGSAMSNATIYSGDFKDVLSAGRDSLRNEDNLKSIAISGLSAGITAGFTEKLNLDVKNNFTDKLKYNAISGASNTALQSTINGDSFSESLKNQLVNTIVMTGAEYGANAIGSNYYDGNINKPEQLLLHAGLGAVSSKLTGGDYASGAISGVVGELAGEYFRDSGFNKQDGSDLAGLVSGLSAIVVAKSEGKDVSDISNEAYAGQRVGKNASENNAYRAKRKLGNGGKLDNYKNNENSFSNKHNLEYLHEQWFFEDVPNDNIGYFGDGFFSGGEIRPDSDNLLDNYTRIDEESYDDAILREALKNIDRNKYEGKYNIITNNCQDFSEDLRKEYFKIRGNKISNTK